MNGEVGQQDKVGPRYNVLAIIGLVLSLSMFLGFLIGGAVGIIFGIVGLIQIRRTHEKGKGLALAAIIIGLGFSIFLGFTLPNMSWSFF